MVEVLQASPMSVPESGASPALQLELGAGMSLEFAALPPADFLTTVLCGLHRMTA